MYSSFALVTNSYYWYIGSSLPFFKDFKKICISKKINLLFICFSLFSFHLLFLWRHCLLCLFLFVFSGLFFILEVIFFSFISFFLLSVESLVLSFAYSYVCSFMSYMTFLMSLACFEIVYSFDLFCGDIFLSAYIVCKDLFCLFFSCNNFV